MKRELTPRPRRAGLTLGAAAALVLSLAVAGGAVAEQVFTGTIMPDTPCATPYWIKQGAEPGPVIFILGGVHGDETAGYLAAERLLDWTVLSGTLVLIPRGHRMAIERGVRAYPGNMNTMFPGDPEGTLMQRLAAAIWHLLKETRPDLLLTLHESVGFHADDPARYGQTLTYDWPELTPLMQRAIDRVNPVMQVPKHRFLLLVRAFRGCPTYMAWRWLQIPATSIETCRQLPLEERIRHQLLMIMGFLDEFGMDYEPVGLSRLPTAPPRPAPPDEPGPEEPPADENPEPADTEPSSAPPAEAPPAG